MSDSVINMHTKPTDPAKIKQIIEIVEKYGKCQVTFDAISSVKFYLLAQKLRETPEMEPYSITITYSKKCTVARRLTI